MTTRKRWKYLGVFVAALLVSSAVHLGWHLFESEPELPAEALEPTIKTCLPPFCDEAKPAQGIELSYEPSDKGAPTEAPTIESNNATYSRPALAPFPRRDSSPQGYAIDDATHKACVYDLSGNAGEQIRIMAAWQKAAMEVGLWPALIVYTDPDVALQDFKAGACQAVWLPGGLNDSVLPALDTLEAFGALPMQEHVKVLQPVLLSENAARYQADDKHSLMGLLFSGPAYLLLHSTPEGATLPDRLAGLSIATTNEAQGLFAAALAATAVNSSRASSATRFNNGSVNAMFATLDMIEPLELRKGLNPDGYVYSEPMFQSTYRLVADAKAFSTEQLAWSRRYFIDVAAQQWEQQVQFEQEMLGLLPVINIGSNERAALEDSLQQLRLELRDEGQYDSGILTLMRKVRCKVDVSRQECVNPAE